MKRFKGTKGSWIIKDKPFFDEYSNVWKVAIYSDSLNFCQYIAGKTEGEALANAQLIATAPELLEALIESNKLIDWLLENGEFGVLLESAYNNSTNQLEENKSLINKALGL